MAATQTIIEWTHQLGVMRVTLADQFCVNILDTDICAHALQGSSRCTDRCETRCAVFTHTCILREVNTAQREEYAYLLEK